MYVRNKPGSPFLSLPVWTLSMEIRLIPQGGFWCSSVFGSLCFHFSRLPSTYSATDDGDRRGVGSRSLIRDKLGEGC